MQNIGQEQQIPIQQSQQSGIIGYMEKYKNFRPDSMLKDILK